MKKNVKSSLLVVSISILLVTTSFRADTLTSADLQGAWQFGPNENRTVMIKAGNVFSVATYNIPEKKFMSSYGGTWRIEGDKLIQKIEWNSKDTSEVGKDITLNVSLKKNKLSVAQKKETWDRMDDGKPGQLAGAWIISGNYSNDVVQRRANPFFPRRTMKLLSGTRFQWIAYNVKTKKFDNTGGGTYTTINGKYSETIEFFTKTSESVGKTLQFDFSIDKNDWRHKGQKSTGGPMDECWTKRETYE